VRDSTPLYVTVVGASGIIKEFVDENIEGIKGKNKREDAKSLPYTFQLFSSIHQSLIIPS